jgi:hypothetical protein
MFIRFWYHLYHLYPIHRVKCFLGAFLSLPFLSLFSQWCWTTLLLENNRHSALAMRLATGATIATVGSYLIMYVHVSWQLYENKTKSLSLYNVIKCRAVTWNSGINQENVTEISTVPERLLALGIYNSTKVAEANIKLLYSAKMIRKIPRNFGRNFF